MATISKKSQLMPASAIRKLTPYADQAAADGVKVYRLNLGAPDIKSPKCAIDAIKSFNLDHVSYSNSAGMIELRKALSEKYYKKLGINIEPSEIVVNTAGSEAVDMVVQLCCDQGDELITIEPFYTNYNTFVYKNDVVLKAVKTDIRDGFRVPDISEFEKLITPKTKAILISNPGNPTGALYSKEEMLALGDIARKYDLFLISDEVYREFCFSDEKHFSALNIPNLDQNVILVDSVSKRYNLCGCRIGCIASHNKDIINAAIKYAQARLSPPVLGQIATIGALDTPDEYFDAVKEEYIKRRDYTVNTLNSFEGVYTPCPNGAFYTIAELPVDNAEKFAKWMLTDFRLNNETTMVTPAETFYKTPGVGVNQIRIAYVLEVPELEKALFLLNEGLKAYPGRV